MKWVTRECVHLDRVASPWLIKRFVDRDAQFAFVLWDRTNERPADAIPFGIPGVELGAHDENGTTFDKILRKYQLEDPGLSMLAQIIRSGVHHALHHGRADQNDVPNLEGIGLDALSEGIMLLAKDDAEAIECSMLIYDALYLYCRAHLLLESDSSLQKRGLVERTGLLRSALSGALPQ